jgi:hypothetical protein
MQVSIGPRPAVERTFLRRPMRLEQWEGLACISVEAVDWLSGFWLAASGIEVSCEL